MADVLAVRDEYRAQNWAMVIRECNSSGLSNREFCRQRGISEKTYDYWLRKLRSQMAESAVPQLVQLESAPVPIQDDMLQISFDFAVTIIADFSDVVKRKRAIALLSLELHRYLR